MTKRSAGEQIATAFSAILDEQARDRIDERLREIREQLKLIPSGTHDTPETTALWNEYDSLLDARR